MLAGSISIYDQCFGVGRFRVMECYLMFLWNCPFDRQLIALRLLPFWLKIHRFQQGSLWPFD